MFSHSIARNRTKIVATIGPASDSKEVLKQMISLGVNVIRINFSHAEHDEALKRIKLVHEINDEYGFNTAILADLQGPKLRVGEMKENSLLEKGSRFDFINQPILGDQTRAYMTYQNFPKDVKVRERILLDDGKLVLECTHTDGKNEVQTLVIQGGILKSKKGVNLPNTQVSLPALTEKDKEDARFALKAGVDWMALSFVRKKQDLLDIKEFIKTHSERPIPVIAKIEKPEAIVNIDEIVKHADGLMVARGDLGVEVPMEEVPLLQKKLVDKAKIARIPVIIATQMMESMLENITPTRAEVNDVANSVLDGADAVMLSAETSVGKYPVEVVLQMSKIIQHTEDDPRISVPHYKLVVQSMAKKYITDRMCYTATKLAEQAQAKAIIILTHTGYNAFQISSHRPPTHILAYTDNKHIIRRLNLLWGVIAFHYERFVNTDETIKDINKIALEGGFLNKGDYVVNLSTMPVVEKGDSNTIRLSEVK
ncbi:pyruvate kinase [Bacteroidetes bacterium endosymbiont of Geopemphigus sp.]|uniref:pyruvate kinase n=1 Tax=Bacteroidetes bacterium endosymbiont of Geopemphigus sp. TaxID=2047937 RepID=UPI000CD25659|nr:pyruvate kinase [Bacteroidetes bacterium endosymbiont of Geopemphigus sp.]